MVNNAHGDRKELPFDILQHRWPIEYRFTDQTQVGPRRFDKLSEALAAAIRDCEQFSLARATEMAATLDTATMDFIAHNEKLDFIEMPLPSKTMGQLLVGLDHILAARRLLELGALHVINTPYVGYAWTYDGKRMIDEINRIHKGIFEALRRHKANTEPS